MIDQEVLVRIINDALPIVAASPVAVKLIDAAEKVIKTLYSPVLTFRNGKAEVDVEMYRRKMENDILVNQSFTLYEINKLKNFANTVLNAENELQSVGDTLSEEETEAADIDFDWMMRFFDAVGNISNADLQRLWGKVLAGEIKSPGKCSLRTIDIIRNMSSKEAKIYNDLCKYVLVKGNSYFIFADGYIDWRYMQNEAQEYLLNKKINYDDTIIPMIECGLISTKDDLTIDCMDGKVIIYNNCISCFISMENSEVQSFPKKAFFLTTSGKELYHIIKNTSDFIADTEYAIKCFSNIKDVYPELEIIVYDFKGDECINLE